MGNIIYIIDREIRWIIYKFIGFLNIFSYDYSYIDLYISNSLYTI